MCGICGFNWSDQALIRRMTEVIRHRGPDQDGLYVDDGVSLGHRRLSIIDLSEHGRQPLGNEDGSIQIVFNGEIYNFPELKRDLLAKGHRFVGASDTEVLVHGYEEYGYDLLGKLNGIFAFAIWDRNRERLWLVRDPIGVKPLYYHLQGGRLLFASEIKSILECSGVQRAVNLDAFYQYLCFEFVAAPATMFDGIHKLPAGHHAVFEKGKLEVFRYWEPDFTPRQGKVDLQELVERQRELIEASVRRQMLSDVPLGAFLSGGLDSSTIVAMMRKIDSGRIRTFTIGYKDKSFSELEYAQVVAERFETDHQVLMIDEMKQEDVEASLWHLDEPMTDLSSIPLMMLCRQAKQHVTVCLSGEGGDEVFAGYDRFKAARLARMTDWIPDGIRQKLFSGVASMLPDQAQKKGPVNLMKRFLEGSALPKNGMHLRWQFFSNPRLERGLYQEAFKAKVPMRPFDPLLPYVRGSAGSDVLNRQIHADLRFMMTDSVLMKVDKMSMASGLEIRVPLLDVDLVNYMATIPGNLKLRGQVTKYAFRKALEGILPESIVYRGKQGYSLPIKHLLRGQLKGYMVELLHESPLLREHVNLAFVDQLIAEHLSMKHNHNHVLWGLMNLAIWHKRFFLS
jgi:asparagine synthase (glutamine-hydrolysing)